MKVPQALAAAGIALIALGISACSSSNGQSLEPGTKSIEIAAVVHDTRWQPLPEDKKVTFIEKLGTLPSGLAPSDWYAYASAPSSKTLPISLSFGTCGERHHETIFVEETPTTVLVDVWDGPTTDNISGACAGTGRDVSYSVHLQAPIGSRKLLTHEIAKA